MTEIKKEIKQNADGSFTITDAHSTADIVRWLLTQDSKETILYLLKEEAPQRKPLTDELVLAGARALAKRHADSCGLDFDDVWKYYAEEHKIDAKAVIEAAHGVKEKNT